MRTPLQSNNPTIYTIYLKCTDRSILMLQKSQSGITDTQKMFKFCHNWCTVDTVDYFDSTEQPAQLQKTADEEFLPGEGELKKKSLKLEAITTMS